LVAFAAGAIRTVTNCAESNDADYRKKNSPSHIRGLLDTKHTGIDRLTRLSDEWLDAERLSATDARLVRVLALPGLLSHFSASVTTCLGTPRLVKPCHFN
jgi:hypothetical protein